METLVLSPELVEALKGIGTGSGSPGKPKSEAHRRRISEAEKGKLISKETREKISISLTGRRRTFSEEHRRNLSEANTGKTWSEERCEEASRARRGIPKSEGAIAASAASLSRYLVGLSPKEMQERMENSAHSPTARSKASKTMQKRPTETERILDRFLQDSFSGKFAYTGDGRHMEVVRAIGYTGRRCPDFVDITGKRQVVSVMGGLGYTHFLDDEREEKEHYAQYGIGCIVVWDNACWLPGELDKLFQK